MNNYKELKLWMKSMDLVVKVYSLTKKYPKDELFCLVQQSKRAVVSIPSNIAEGMGRNHRKDTVHFLHISRGSIYEIETLIYIGKSLDYISENEFKIISDDISECMKMLNGLISYQEKYIKK